MASHSSNADNRTSSGPLRSLTNAPKKGSTPGVRPKAIAVTKNALAAAVAHQNATLRLNEANAHESRQADDIKDESWLNGESGKMSFHYTVEGLPAGLAACMPPEILAALSKPRVSKAQLVCSKTCRGRCNLGHGVRYIE